MNYESLGYTAPATKLRLYTERKGIANNLIKYLHDAPEKLDNLNEPDLLDFALVPDNAGVLEGIRPKRGDYIRFETEKYGLWFTGYVTNDADLEYLGGYDTPQADPIPVWGYKYKATSDEIILSKQPLGIVHPFVNTRYGAIIRSLADRLAPGKFDTTNVQDGLIVARYEIDPKATFSDVVKELADQINFRFYAKDRKLYFEPQDAQPAALSIDGQDRYFTPSELTIKVSEQNTIVNDATVIGDAEPQNYVNEYFVGNGFQGSFPLVSSIYGIESSLLLDETFGGTAIDEGKWTLFDSVVSYLQVADNYLNVTGGNQNNTLDTWLQSAQLVPLEGNIRIMHGEWDFLESKRVGTHGVVCGLWTNSPRIDRVGCVFGINVEYTAGGEYRLQQIVNGVLYVNNTVPITTNRPVRYIIRTVVGARHIFRLMQQYSFINEDGRVVPIGGGGISDFLTFATVITEYDINQNKVTNQWSWQAMSAVDQANPFAYYVPAASNDLHATVSNISISTPLQADLAIKPKGDVSFYQKFIGPNEIDSFDGHSPIATITTSGGGQVSKTGIGSSRYNAHNATLAFLFDSVKQEENIPKAGDIIRLRYRRSGTSIARVADTNSITAEAALWGDNGRRSLTTTDLDPRPRTSAECELAAAALVNESKYRHYEGDYNTYSGFGFTGEPTSGTILSFRNLPTTTFPDPVQLPIAPFDTGEKDRDGNPIIDPGDPNTYNFFEQITEVRSKLIAVRPGELYEHSISFGYESPVKKVLTKFRKQGGVMRVEDTVEVPDAIDTSVLGQGDVVNVTDCQYTGLDTSSLYFDAGQEPPTGGGFEVRYTDEGWGIDDGKNLITRTTGRTWSVPRTQRGRVCFVRAYDSRNKVRYSEDLTNAAWSRDTGVSTYNALEVNEDGNKSNISIATLGNNKSVWQAVSSINAANTSGVFTVSLKGAKGVAASLLVQANSTTYASKSVTMTGDWMRVSLPFTPTGTQTGSPTVVVKNTSPLTQTLRISRAAVEAGVPSETVYCKTLASPHGAYSRFATVNRVNLPLKPTAATAVLDIKEVTAPVVSFVMPDLASDIWGIELRDSDNSTILYKKDLTETEWDPKFVLKGNKQRNLLMFLYTYNVLGEYSDPFPVQYSIPQPVVSNLRVDDDDRSLKWDAIGSKGVVVNLWAISGGYTPAMSWPTQAQKLSIADSYFFPAWRFEVVPYDDLGSGPSSTVVHEYIPAGMVSFDQDQVASVLAPATPTAQIVPPVGFEGREEEYRELVTRLYIINRKQHLD